VESELNLPEPTDPSFPGFRRVTRLDLPSVPAAPRLPRELWLRFAQLRTLAEADAEGKAQIRTDALLGFADAADMALVRLELVCVGVETWSVRLLRRRLRLVDASFDFLQVLYDADRDQPCVPEELIVRPTMTVLRSSGGGELVARSIHLRAHENPAQPASVWPESDAPAVDHGAVARAPQGSGHQQGGRGHVER
jgi:hypothetical protein